MQAINILFPPKAPVPQFPVCTTTLYNCYYLKFKHRYNNKILFLSFLFSQLQYLVVGFTSFDSILAAENPVNAVSNPSLIWAIVYLKRINLIPWGGKRGGEWAKRRWIRRKEKREGRKREGSKIGRRGYSLWPLLGASIAIKLTVMGGSKNVKAARTASALALANARPYLQWI
jgi:hypothetical protein